MGYRTVVVLYNDHASEWEKDPELGRKIARGMNYAAAPCLDGNDYANLNYGRVVECVHADQQTVAILDSYAFKAIGTGYWRPGESEEEKSLRLLKEAADNLGYRLVKKGNK